MAVRFPSLEFFQALQALMSAERERFKRLGYFDATIGVRILDGAGGRFECVLEFEVFDCTAVRAAGPSNAAAVDFILEGALDTWVDMLHNIQRHGAADVDHSINTLTHFGERLRVVYDDPDGHDKLYRFAESVQEFFDLAAKLDIAFPERAAAARV
jgi:hypothetical protein